MRKLYTKLFLFLCLCSLILIFYATRLSKFNLNAYNNNLTLASYTYREDIPFVKKRADRVVISFVVCDSRFNESLNLVKSSLLFSRVPLYFIIFSDDNLRNNFSKALNDWKKILGDNLDFEIQRIVFPEEHREEWMNLFSKCAAQRLFIPKLIPHVDAMLYVDTDTIFLGPPEQLWDFFSHFDASQISAMSLEDDNPNISWYPRFAKHPFYGKYGLNSGVMLMNLTRMREFGWVDYVTPIMLKYKLYIPWGDQDIINIIFHYHEKAVYLLSCRYNYRTDQCMYGDACADATKNGVFILHGSRRAFHNHKQPAFEAVYRAIDEYEVGGDRRAVLSRMEEYLDAAPESSCGSLRSGWLKLPRLLLDDVHVKPDR